MKKWEYATFESNKGGVSDDNDGKDAIDEEVYLDDMGDSGWELISVVSTGQFIKEFYMKREKE